MTSCADCLHLHFWEGGEESSFRREASQILRREENGADFSPGLTSLTFITVSEAILRIIYRALDN
jgi:hypothetical protein